MKGLILSGGKGTRLRPLTYTQAKQLIPVANKPVLVRVIETIRDAGIDEIGIIIGETGEEIKAALAERDLGVNLTYIYQNSPDGLAHAVKIAQDFLGDESFVMFLGDNVLQGGINELVQSFTENHWNSQVVLKEVPYEKASLYGVALLRQDGSIEKLIEKPPEPPSNLALMGIYMFDSHIFEAVHAIKPSARGEYEITDAIQWLIDHDYAVYPHIHQGWWIDTGKPNDMLAANDHVLAEIVPTIAADAEIVDSQIDPRVTVESGAKIINSIVRGPTIIGTSAIIRNSYVGPFTSIYHHTVLEDVEVEHSIILEHSIVQHFDVRLQDSLIGRHAKLSKADQKPLALKMNLGDHSTIWML